MYKILKNIVIIIGMLLVTIFTVWNVTTNSVAIPGAIIKGINVRESKADINNEIEKIANIKGVVIAKQILIPSDSAKDDLSIHYTFQKIGKGKLPLVYPEEKNKQIIESSNNNANYIIIGSGLSSKELSEQLQAQGNVTVVANYDTRFEPARTLSETYRIPILIILSSFGALLLAEHISKIKGDGIRRLAGISRTRLAFSSAIKDTEFIFATFICSTLIGTIAFAALQKICLAYIESLAFTALLGAIAFFDIDIGLSALTFYVLQMQTISLSIKGKAPMLVIAIVIIAFQGLASISSMSSISDLNNANKQLGLLQTAQKSWTDKKEYYAPTIIGMAMKTNPQARKNLLIDLLKQPDVLLSSSMVLQTSETDNGYQKGLRQYMIPTDGSPTMNILYANPALLQKEGIKLSLAIQNKITHFKAGEYAILVPESQKENFETLTYTWSSAMSSMAENHYTENPVTSLYQAKKSVFAYSVMKNQTVNYSSIAEPIIIVWDSETFESGTAVAAGQNALAALSQGSLLTTNREAVKKLFIKYGLKQSEGSFFNGYYAVSAKLEAQQQQRNLLVGVNILCLLSSLLLISLLNSIYLYQNRRNFLIQRLAGKSWVDIHMVYIAVVMTLTVVISALARVWLHVPNEALIVPLIYLVLVFTLFTVQIHREKSANVLYLKGL